MTTWYCKLCYWLSPHPSNGLEMEKHLVNNHNAWSERIEHNVYDFFTPDKRTIELVKKAIEEMQNKIEDLYKYTNIQDVEEKGEEKEK